MRSPADARRALEWAARLLAASALGVLLWRALHERRAPGAERATSATLSRGLVRWSTGAAVPPPAVYMTFDAVPSAGDRDWIAALARTGTRVLWDAPHLVPLAVSVWPLADPTGGYRVSVAAPSGHTVTLADGAGTLDSARAHDGGATFTVPTLDGAVRATAGATRACARPRNSLLLRRVLVVGAAGWESRFIVTALEERGWRVDARLHVAPNVDVIDGTPGMPDTARYAAVVAVDSTAAPLAAQLMRYVRTGGGLIVSGTAATVNAFAPLLAGGSGAPRRAAPRALADSGALEPLALRAIAPLRSGAIPLEQRRTRTGFATAVAARRIANGRVLQIGYDDSWRWRMAGSGDAVAAHRNWWSAALRSVAYAPAVALAWPTASLTTPTASPVPVDTLDNAPIASLVTRLGPAAPPTVAEPASGADPRTTWLLFTLFVTALFVEWASRRLRGEK